MLANSSVQSWLRAGGWRSGALLAGLGSAVGFYVLRLQRRDYEKMHQEIFGSPPLPWAHRRPAEWVKHELLFGWVDLLAAEVNAAVYFTFHSERRARWERLHARYGPQPAPPLTVADVKKTLREAPQRLRTAWAVLTEKR